MDAGGHYFFRDRISDVVRRRGENIATFEAEAELAQHPSVREVACIGVASEEGVEQELHALVIAEQDAALDFAAIAEWAGTRLPRFMVPRFFSEHTEFPRTPTGRVQSSCSARGHRTARSGTAMITRRPSASGRTDVQKELVDDGSFHGAGDA